MISSRDPVSYTHLGLVKGNHTAIHGDVLLGILVHQSRNVPPVLKRGDGSGCQLSKQAVGHALVFRHSWTGGDITNMGIVLAGCAFIIGILETLLVN